MTMRQARKLHRSLGFAPGEEVPTFKVWARNALKGHAISSPKLRRIVG